MKNENNSYAYISIVAIVAIVAVFVMFAGNNKQTSETIVLSGGDVIGDARYISDVQKRDDTTLSSEEIIQRDINDGFLKEESTPRDFFWDENRINAYSEGNLIFLEDKFTGEVRVRGCSCAHGCPSYLCYTTIGPGGGNCRGRCSAWSGNSCSSVGCGLVDYVFYPGEGLPPR